MNASSTPPSLSQNPNSPFKPSMQYHGAAPTLHHARPRRNPSFPSDMYLMNQRPKASSETLAMSTNDLSPEAPPSLVSQLQQVHGLTKKKVYGAKPTRKPFFREERVHKEPTGMSLPAAAPAPLTTAGGRAVSRSRAERAIRVAQSSPTEPHSRRLTRRGSRVSSPEMDSLTPPSYNIPPNLASPVPLISTSNAYVPSAPAAASHQQYGMDPDPSWLQMSAPTALPSFSQTQFQGYTNPQPQPMSPDLFENRWQTNVSMDIMSSSAIPGVEETYFSIAHEPPHQELGMSSQIHGGTGENPPYRLSRRTSCPEDEEPFTFNAEYVAATAALFKSEVLPAYPHIAAMDRLTHPQSSDLISPRHAFYIAQDRNSVPPSPTSTYNPGELYGAAHREEYLPHSLSSDYPIASADSPGLGYATSYSPGSSSSLTGWAG